MESSKTPRIVALIGCKKESGRLKNKNWRDFNGKPLFQWNVEKALRLFSEVYVSSDYHFILNIAEQLGATPIVRPEELCGETPNISFYKHAQKEIQADIIVAIQANSPTLREDIIETVIELMREGRQEVKTSHPQDRKDYGSIWAMTKERLANYPDPYHAKPDVWITDDSVDIHTLKDYQKALSDFKFNE